MGIAPLERLPEQFGDFARAFDTFQGHLNVLSATFGDEIKAKEMMQEDFAEEISATSSHINKLETSLVTQADKLHGRVDDLVKEKFVEMFDERLADNFSGHILELFEERHPLFVEHLDKFTSGKFDGVIFLCL